MNIRRRKRKNRLLVITILVFALVFITGITVFASGDAVQFNIEGKSTIQSPIIDMVGLQFCRQSYNLSKAPVNATAPRDSPYITSKITLPQAPPGNTGFTETSQWHNFTEYE